MKPELREALGMAAYNARHADEIGLSIWRPWDEMHESIREEHRIEAEAVVNKIAEMLTEEQIKAILRTLEE